MTARPDELAPFAGIVHTSLEKGGVIGKAEKAVVMAVKLGGSETSPRKGGMGHEVT